MIPYGWIADSTRWMRKPKSYSGLVDMLSTTRDTYRRALWSTQPAYVEVWLEKDALAGVIYTETEDWDVPLMVTRGTPASASCTKVRRRCATRTLPPSSTTWATATRAASTSRGLSRRSSGLVRHT